MFVCEIIGSYRDLHILLGQLTAGSSKTGSFTFNSRPFCHSCCCVRGHQETSTCRYIDRHLNASPLASIILICFCMENGHISGVPASVLSFFSLKRRAGNAISVSLMVFLFMWKCEAAG